MDGLHQLLTDQGAAESAGLLDAARRHVDRDMTVGHEVEVDRGLVGEERHDGLGAIDRGTGHVLEHAADEVPDLAAQGLRRDLRAVVPGEVGGSHGGGDGV